MPPKVQFTKEKILDEAYKLVINQGIDALSARSLAKELGSSVAPIYVNFKNTTELFEAVMKRIGQVVWSYCTKPYTKYGFFNIGIGQLLIARDYPLIFKDITLKYPKSMTMEGREWEMMIDIMERDELLKGLSRRQCASILEKMAIQTSGLSMALATGSSSLTLERALTIMEETANQLIYAELSGLKIEKNLEINIDL